MIARGAVANDRSVATDPSVLILDEPTRGIDVGARAEIYRGQVERDFDAVILGRDGERRTIGNIHVPIPGRHNVQNALAAITPFHVPAEARRLTRVRRFRYYPVRISADGIIEVAILDS